MLDQYTGASGNTSPLPSVTHEEFDPYPGAPGLTQITGEGKRRFWKPKRDAP